MSKSRDPRSSPAIILPPPQIDGFLPAMPGGETNLLPEALTRGDLKVWFTVPAHSDPSAGQETVELFVDDDPDPVVIRDDWTQPIADTDRFVVLPQQWLRNNDGEHRLNYKMTIYNTAWDTSSDLVMTLDTQAPVLDTVNKLIFPPAILPPNKLTALYLEQNDDKVKVDLPAYTTPRPWDIITWYWGVGPGDFNVGGVIELDDQNYADAVVIEIEGDLIRDRGDGPRFVMYQVKDRAGNLSTYSDFVELSVDAKPIPRLLPWPSIVDAAGTGQQQTFDPQDGRSGAVVEIPADAVIHPGEKAWVRWGEPGTVGAYEARVPIAPGGRRFAIPMASVAAFIGKSLTVSYFVTEAGGGEPESDQRTLVIRTLPSNGLPRVQCQGLSGGSLSYASVPATGAAVTLATWMLMTTDQHIRIRITGIAQTGAESHSDVVPPRAVTALELTTGIRGVVVTKAFLNSLRRDTPLTGKVYVSFDGGTTWPPLTAPNFPLLQLTFTA